MAKIRFWTDSSASSGVVLGKKLAPGSGNSQNSVIEAPSTIHVRPGMGIPEVEKGRDRMAEEWAAAGG